MWVCHGTRNSFYDKSYVHLKLTNSIFPLLSTLSYLRSGLLIVGRMMVCAGQPWLTSKSGYMGFDQRKQTTDHSLTYGLYAQYLSSTSAYSMLLLLVMQVRVLRIKITYKSSPNFHLKSISGESSFSEDYRHISFTFRLSILALLDLAGACLKISCQLKAFQIQFN